MYSATQIAIKHFKQENQIRRGLGSLSLENSRINNNNNFIQKKHIKIQSIQFSLTFLKPFQVDLNKAIIGQETFNCAIHQCDGQLNKNKQR